MALRPISGRVQRWLIGEMENWWKQEILTGEQADRILRLYETEGEHSRRKYVYAWIALCSTAALMVGLAALLLISYNWAEMAATAKLAVIFGTLLGAHGAGLLLRYKTKLRMTSEVAFFLGCLFFGAAIWLIAQVFHLKSHYPDAIWFWALGTLLFALCLDTLLLHVLYAGLLALWVGTEILGVETFDSLRFFSMDFPRSAYTLPVLVLPGLIWGYRKQSPMTVGLYTLLLAWWAVLQPVAWRWDVNPIYFVGLAGALFLMVAEMHRENSPLAVPYRLFGILIVGGALLPLSFGEVLRYLADDGSPAELYVAGLTVALIGATAMLFVVLSQRRETIEPRGTTTLTDVLSPETGVTTRLLHRSKLPFAAILQRQWMPLFLILFFAALCFWNGCFAQGHSLYGSSSGHGYNYDMAKWSPRVLLPLAAVNITMLAFAVWLMRLGMHEDHIWPFFAGVLYVLLWAVLRYIDLFAEIGGMLGAALLFLLCGVGLFAVAWFWLHRKGAENG